MNEENQTAIKLQEAERYFINDEEANFFSENGMLIRLNSSSFTQTHLRTEFEINFISLSLSDANTLLNVFRNAETYLFKSNAALSAATDKFDTRRA